MLLTTAEKRYGGAAEYIEAETMAPGSTLPIHPMVARVYNIAVPAATYGLSVRLPTAADHLPGGYKFLLRNTGGGGDKVFSIVYRSGDGAGVSVSPGDNCLVALLDNSTSDGTWAFQIQGSP